MKQVLINVLSALVLLGTISCQSSPKTYEEHMERLRKTVPTSALNYESVWKTYYGDYTGDGKDELIAFVCEHYGQSEGIYHLYYSTSKKVFVYDTLTLDKSFEAQIIEDGSGSLLYFYYLSDKPSTFEYDDNADLKICLYKCTKKGLSKINPPDEDALFGYDREYNCFFSYSLPIETSIPYFYYVEDGEFREFGGLEVTEDNFKKSIKNIADVEVEVEFKKELVSFPSMFFVIGKTQGGDIFPVIVSKDGEYFIGLSNVLKLSNVDTQMMRDALEKAQKEKEQKDSKVLSQLFDGFLESDFVYLKGDGKNLPTKIVVTDPDCPYCREHLKNVDAELKEANLKLIFAPIHQKEAFIKAQLIMNEVAKLDAGDTKGKIKVLEKYYRDITLDAGQLKTDYSQITKNTDKIFQTGVIKGVPFIFEE